MVTVKMAAILTITLLLLCCFTASQSKCDYNAATGGNVIISLDHQLTNQQTLTWKHEQSVIFAQRYINGELIFVTGNKKNISENGSLKLVNVTKDKSGTYTPEVFNTGGKTVGKLNNKTLCVFGPIPKPNVTNNCHKTAPSKVTFTCKVVMTQDLRIEWLRNKGKTDKTTNPLELNAKEVGKDSFSCNVSNPISFMISDPVTQNCIKSEPSFLFEVVMGVQIWILIASGGGVVLLLILIVIVCCIMNRRKKRLNLKDEEELRLNWTNKEQQHHHHNHNQIHHKHHQHNHPHDHHQQQPAGHTGPRQHRPRQPREQRPRTAEPPDGHPQPSARRPGQGPGPAINNDDEQPPPLPQPRKKVPLPRH